MTEALEVTINTGIAGTSNTEFGTKAELLEALEVTIEAGIAGTSNTELGTRAELPGKGCETLMEVVDKLADCSEDVWPTGCWSSEAAGTLCFTVIIEAVSMLRFAEVNLRNETFR